MKPCSALIEERRGAATPLHALPYPPARMSNTLNLMYQQILLNYLYVVEVCVHVCVYVHVWWPPKWCSYVSVCSAVWAHSSMLVFTCKRGREVGETEFAVSLSVHVGMRLHILQHIAEGWGNLLLSKIIGLLHPVISLIIMKASLQFSNYYSMPILFLSNKEEHWCKTKCQDSISCLCLRAIQRWGTYTPSKYHPQHPT